VQVWRQRVGWHVRQYVQIVRLFSSAPSFWGNPLMPCRVWIGASFPIYHQKILFRRLETFWSWKTSNFCGNRAVPRDPLKKRAVFGGAKNLIEFPIKLLDHQPVCQTWACNAKHGVCGHPWQWHDVFFIALRRIYERCKKNFTFLNFVVIVFVGNSEMGYIQSLVIFFTMIKVSRYQATLGWYICGNL